MPYQTNIPNAGQSPGLFPAQANDNFTRLKTIVGANHKFNDSAATDDGYHQDIKMLPLAVPGNDASIGQSFVNSADATNQMWFKDGLNRVFQLTPTLPIYAAVNFDGHSPVVVRFSHNVASVTRTATGLYTIAFTRALPTNNYIVTGMCMRDTSEGLMQIQADGTYGNSISTTFVKIRVFSLNSTDRDPLAAFVLICGG